MKRDKQQCKPGSDFIHQALNASDKMSQKTETDLIKNIMECYRMNQTIVWEGKYVFLCQYFFLHISLCLTSAPVVAQMFGHCPEPYIITIATRVGEKTHTEHKDPN